MLNDRDFEQALQRIDSIHRKIPHDPQSYFCEGWVYDMQGDSLMARLAYTRSMEIYDSLIIVSKNIDDILGHMINRAWIIQFLYDMDAYNKAIDEIVSATPDSVFLLQIEQMCKGLLFKKRHQVLIFHYKIIYGGEYKPPIIPINCKPCSP